MYKYLACLFLLLPGISYACSIYCSDLDWQYRAAKYLFAGQVTKVEEYGVDSYSGGTKVNVYFDIWKSWKNDWGDRPLKTVNNKDDYCGGHYFQPGDIRLLFVDRDGHIGVCDAPGYESIEGMMRDTADIDELQKQQASPDRAALANKVIQRLESEMGESELHTAFFNELKAAFEIMDKVSIASMIRYPYKGYWNGLDKMIESEAEFLEVFDQLITPRIVATVREQEFYDLYVSDRYTARGVIIGSGELFFAGSCIPGTTGCDYMKVGIFCIDCR